MSPSVPSNPLPALADFAVASGNGIRGLLAPPRGLVGLRRPVFPARQIFLKFQPGPAGIAVGEKHIAVELIQIGRGFGGFESRARNRQQLFTQRFAALNQIRGFIAFAFCECGSRLLIDLRKLLYRARVGFA